MGIKGLNMFHLMVRWVLEALSMPTCHLFIVSFRQSVHVNVCSNLHNTCVTQDPVIVDQPATSIHSHPPSHCK